MIRQGVLSVLRLLAQRRFAALCALVITIVAGWFVLFHAEEHYKAGFTVELKAPSLVDPRMDQADAAPASPVVELPTAMPLSHAVPMTLVALQSENATLTTKWRQLRQKWLRTSDLEVWQELSAVLEAFSDQAEDLTFAADNATASSRSSDSFRLVDQINREDVADGNRTRRWEVLLLFQERRLPLERSSRTLAAMIQDLCQRQWVDRCRQTETRCRDQLQQIPERLIVPAEQALQKFIADELDFVGHLGALEAYRQSRQDSVAGNRIEHLQTEQSQVLREVAALRQLKSQLEPLRSEASHSADTAAAPWDVELQEHTKQQAGGLGWVEPAINVPQTAVEISPILERLRNREADLLVEISEMRAQYNLDHLPLRTKYEVLSNIRQLIREEIGRLVEQTGSQLTALSHRQRELASRISTEQSRADRLAVGLVKYDQLRDQLQRAQLAADQEAQRLQRVIRYCQQYQHDQVADITDHQIDAYVVPRSWRYDVLLFGLLLLAGLMAASMICWLVQKLDPAVYDPEDVEKNTNVEVLAVVPDCQTRLVHHKIS